LKRIRAGMYGTCLICRSSIAFDRLSIIPETKTCVRCS
jgi:RNA polymerase-binding transcription factor DksA